MKKKKDIKQYLNKGISSTVGILIVVSIAIVAGGIITWQTWSGGDSSTTNLIPSPSGDSPATDLIPFGWEVYRNNDYGFSVMYPLDWEMEIKPNLVSMSELYQEGSNPFWISWSKTKIPETQEEFGEYWISFSVRTTAKSDEFYNEFIEDNCGKWGIIKNQKIDDRDAIKCISPTGPAGTNRIWAVKDGIGWEILISGFYDKELEEIAEQMLFTFKFID